MEISKDLLLTAENIAAIMTKMFWRIFSESYRCHVFFIKGEYWSVVLDDHRFTIPEIARMMDAVNAAQNVRTASFPDDDNTVRWHRHGSL